MSSLTNFSPQAKSGLPPFLFVLPVSEECFFLFSFLSFLKGWKKSKEEEYVICENYIKFIFQCQKIKFYWTRVMLIYLHILSGCFCSTRAELSSCNRDPMAHEALRIHCLALYRKRLPTSALEL